MATGKLAGWEETEATVVPWTPSTDVDWSRDSGPIRPQLATEIPGNPADWSHNAWPVKP